MARQRVAGGGCHLDSIPQDGAKIRVTGSIITAVRSSFSWYSSGAAFHLIGRRMNGISEDLPKMLL